MTKKPGDEKDAPKQRRSKTTVQTPAGSSEKKTRQKSEAPAGKSTSAKTLAESIPKDQAAKPPGRPRGGSGKSATQRASEFDAALLTRGGRILNKVRLDKGPTDALARLKDVHGTERAAIEYALVACDPRG